MTSRPQTRPNPNIGRIRLHQDQAEFLLDTLNEKRHRLIVRRADAKSRGEDPSLYNRMVLKIDSILEELHRTMEEKGWPHGPA